MRAGPSAAGQYQNCLVGVSPRMYDHSRQASTGKNLDVGQGAGVCQMCIPDGDADARINRMPGPVADDGGEHQDSSR